MTQFSHNPPILAQKQQKMAIFDKTDFWGLKYPLEVWVQHKICSTICGTPVPAILNHKNLREGVQRMEILGKQYSIEY